MNHVDTPQKRASKQVRLAQASEKSWTLLYDGLLEASGVVLFNDLPDATRAAMSHAFTQAMRARDRHIAVRRAYAGQRGAL